MLALERMGLDVWVVTGDNRRVAAALARRLGVAPHRVMAEVLPAEKARKVLYQYTATVVLLWTTVKKKLKKFSVIYDVLYQTTY